MEGFGVRPQIGRAFVASDFTNGAPQVALVSHRLWQTRFGGTPDVVGRRVEAYVNDRPGEPQVFTIVGVLPKDMWHLNVFTEFMAPLRDGTLQQKLLYYYQKTFLPEFVCMHTDRAAMQSSLEVRSPFLSLPLVEFANRLPDRFKMKNGNLKVLLRRVAAKQGLSAEIVKQRKQGFTFPVARWLKTTRCGPMSRRFFLRTAAWTN